MRAIRVAPRNFAEVSELSGYSIEALKEMHDIDVKLGDTTLYYVETRTFKTSRR